MTKRELIEMLDRYEDDKNILFELYADDVPVEDIRKNKYDDFEVTVDVFLEVDDIETERDGEIKMIMVVG